MDEPDKTPAAQLQEWALQAKAGNKAALEHLLTNTQCKQLIYHITARHFDAEHGNDIYQEVCERVIRSISTWQASSHIQHWISRITVNCCYNHLRARYRESEKAQHLKNHQKTLGDIQRNHHAPVIEQIIEAEKHRIMNALLHEMSEPCQSFLRAYICEHHHRHDIMRWQNWSKTTFYKHLQQCSQMLLRKIIKYYGNDGQK